MPKRSSSKPAPAPSSEILPIAETLKQYYIGEKLVDIRRLTRHPNCRPIRQYGVQRLIESLASQGYISAKHTFFVIESVDFLPWANEKIPLEQSMKTPGQLLDDYSKDAEPIGIMFDGGHMGTALIKSQASPTLYVAKTFKSMPPELVMAYIYALNDATSSCVEFSLFDRIQVIRKLAVALKPQQRAFATAEAVFSKVSEFGLQLKRPTVVKYHGLAVNLSDEAWNELSSMLAQSSDIGVQLNNLYVPPFTHSDDTHSKNQLPMLKRLVAFKATNNRAARADDSKNLYKLLVKASAIVAFFKARLQEHRIDFKPEWNNKMVSLVQNVTYDGQLEANSSIESLVPCLTAIALSIKKNNGVDILKAADEEAKQDDMPEEVKEAEPELPNSQKRKADEVELDVDDRVPPPNPAEADANLPPPAPEQVEVPPPPPAVVQADPAEATRLLFKKKYLLRQTTWQDLRDDPSFQQLHGKVDLVLTDPPYGVFPEAHDKIADEDFAAFSKVISQILNECGTAVIF